MAATESLDSSTSLVTTASASQATESDTVSITAIIHNPQSDEGCDSPDSSDGSTQVSSQVVVTSPASEPHTPHYIVAEGATRSYTSLTTVSTAVTDGETVGEVSTVHPTYVQYTVDGTEQAIYATTTNGQITYPVFAVGENYTPGSGQYYTSGNTAVTYTQVTQTGQSIITGNTYLIQPSVDHENAHTIITGSRTSPDTVNAEGANVYMVSSNNSVSMDGERIDSNISNATRVSPATVQWLLENYECFEGVSLPRSTMYAHYLRHCSEHKLDPVNAASFGKLIRSVFLGLRTRRLGTRGNSKYHYYGIRIKPGSSLTHISDDPVVNAPRSGGNNKRFKQTPGMKTESQYESAGNHNTSPQDNDNQQYLGDGLGAIPEFPAIKLNSFLEDSDVTLEDVDTLRNIYREHCEAFLEAVLNLEFQTIESLWREFWRSQDNNNGDECEEEKYLSKSKLYSLCKLQPIQEFMRSVDYVFYQNIVQVLIPDVLRPIPSSLTQSIRNFAKGLENWLTGAMNGCPQEMVLIKVSAVSALAQTLRRYTSLNHLAQAARAVLQNSSQITQMLADLNRVDFHNVQEQASWVCECEDSVVQRLEADFKATLQQQNSLESWALWLKNVVAQVLKPFEGKPNFAKAARQFLLKWSFYSSMVIRDLTLRSAASFGSFHLIRLLYDEYMFYLVEHEVALATGETPIAVMSEMEWVEIIEPRTKEHIYANLTTGECVWDPPPGVPVKKTDDNQWWELFDQNTSRFYYYNAISQKTDWHRPNNCDIIPLAKLQTLKQNTEPVGEDGEESKTKESVGTQTPGKCVRPPKPYLGSHTKTSVSCETQTSPGNSPRVSRRSHHHSHSHSHSHSYSHSHSHSHHHHGSNSQHRTPQKTSQSQDSGRSSDSSSRASSDNHRILESPRHNRHYGPSLSTSTSTPVFDKKPLQEINSQPVRGASEKSNAYKANKSNSTQHSNVTTSQSIIGGLKPGANISIAKQKSFDVETGIGIGGCYSNYGHENFRGRSKPEKQIQTQKDVSVGVGADLARSCSFIQRRDTSQDEEDSMHEKYFLPPSQSGLRSIESTPQARRKQTFLTASKSRDLDLISTPRSRRPFKSNEHSRSRESRRYSEGNDTQSGSSENETSNTSQSPITTSPSSPISASRKNNRINQTDMFSGIEPPSHRHSSQSHSDESKASTYDDAKETQRRKDLKEYSHMKDNIRESSGDTLKKHQNREFAEQKEHMKQRNFNEARDLIKGEQYKDKSDYRPLDTKDSRDLYRENGNHGNVPSHIKFYSMERGYDKINSSAPLYSNLEYSPYNMDNKNQSHLFPLHQYILEQAKLSGCYKFGDPLNDEMDSLHSEDETSVGRAEYDSDEFADDEGMSNQGDSSSQEYLDDPNYYEQDEFLKRCQKFPQEFKNDVGYIESLESRMAVNTTPQGVYYSGVAPTPYPQRFPPPVVPPNAPETQHASLKRKKDAPTPPILNLYSPVMEKTENANRPISLPSQVVAEDFTDRPESPRLVLSRDKKLPSESDIEEYAQGHLNIHKKGIFRKKFSVRDMLSWSKDPIRKPMLVLAEKALKKDACELFKLVQIYMSDRKAKIGMTLNSVALDICNLGYNKPFLRDELYIQICRQTTENPRLESLRRGWELMAICLNFFPPSAKFQSYLEGYMNRHRDSGFDFPEVVKWPLHVQISHYATVSCKRLERIGINGKKPSRKPTIEEIDQSRLQIFRASMFGSTLEEVMHLQKERFPNRRLPWVQTILSEEILRLQGAQTEGIFRVSADVDEVNLLKTKIDHWEVPTETVDAHAPASLLKLWYRELYEPLIPDGLYSECVTHHDDPEYALEIVQRLPNLNKLVLYYLVRFLQIFSRDEVVQVTKMDASNLAMVMAPNCLRCTSSDPRVIFDNARKEMSFMKTLIQSLDTSFMEGVF